MKKSSTSLENIKKTTAFLNAFNDFLNKQKGEIKTEDAQTIQDLHKVPYSMMKVAKDLGYFQKIGSQKYQSNYVHFEPIHARALIEAHKKHRAEKQKQKIDKLKTENETFLKIEHKKELKQKSEKPENQEHGLTEAKVVGKKTPTKQRVFSLFWGLIKFNY